MRMLRRSVIWGAGILAILMLALGALVGWRLVEEEMCLRSLDSSHEAERRAAAKRLAAMKSSRAVSKLVPLALKAGVTQGQSYAGDALLAIGGASVPPLLEEVDGSDSPSERMARSLLYDFGRDAVDAFLAGARHGRKEVRLVSLENIGRYVHEKPSLYEVFVKALEDPDWEVRLTAVRPLVNVTGRETEVIGLLTGRLQDPREEPRVRYWAAFDMPVLGVPAQAALREALKHTDPLVRVYAAHALQDYWPDSEHETVPVLLQGLQVPDWRARKQAIDSLSRFDSSSPTKHLTTSVLKSLLEDPFEEVRSAAVRAFKDYKPTEEMVAPLIRILREQSDEGAAEVLARLGPRASAAVPALTDFLTREADSPKGRSAARALGRIGPAAASSVPALAAALKEGCCAALEALGRIGEGALEATPVIVEALSGSDCRAEARPALVGIGPRVIPYLLQALSIADPDPEFRRTIIEILGDFGPSAEAAAGTLVAFAKEGDWGAKREAVRSLGRIGPGAARQVPVILQLLSTASDDIENAATAAEALGRIGIPAGMSTERLVGAARSADQEVRAHALLALGRLKRGDAETIALLRGGLADEEPLVRSFSAMGLRDLGIDDASVAKALPAAFAGDGVFRIVRALEGFPEETKRVLPWLVESLSAGEPEYSIGVIKLIEGLGPDANVALPALLDLARKAGGESRNEGGAWISMDPDVKQYRAADLIEAIEEVRVRLEGRGE